MNSKKCPLSGKRCLDACAWWSDEYMSCAVKDIAVSLDMILQKMPEVEPR